MHQPITADVSASRQAARMMIPLTGQGTDAVSNHALERLRNVVIPATIGKVPGVTVRITGWTAGSLDFTNSMKSHAPLVFLWVLGLAFVLLLVTFRSIVIPLKAIALNLLSVGAAYGVLVLIFQQGHLQSLLGFTSIGGVTDWLPLFLFVILFGLSMDYHVLILSRVKEAHDGGMPTEERRRARHQGHRQRRDQRSDRDGRGVRHLRHASDDRLQDDGRRARRRRAPRCIDRARDPAPLRDEAPRRLELVPPPLAPVAARVQDRGARSPTGAAGGALRATGGAVGCPQPLAPATRTSTPRAACRKAPARPTGSAANG